MSRDDDLPRIDFDWDGENLQHIARHDVTPEEVEAALLGHTLEIAYENRNGEDRFTEVGVTGGGRFLQIVTVERGASIRVVTAFEAPRSAILEYLEFRW